MRAKGATARPFFGLDLYELRSWFEGIGVRLEPDAEFSTSSSLAPIIEVSDSKIAVRLPSLQPPIDPLLPQETDFVLEFIDHTNDVSLPILRKPIGAIKRETIEIDEQVLNQALRWTPGKGASLAAAIVLRRKRPKTPGLPFRIGHILESRIFNINRSGPGADFPVEFADEEEGLRQGLPRGWTYYIIEGK